MICLKHAFIVFWNSFLQFQTFNSRNLDSRWVPLSGHLGINSRSPGNKSHSHLISADDCIQMVFKEQRKNKLHGQCEKLNTVEPRFS